MESLRGIYLIGGKSHKPKVNEKGPILAKSRKRAGMGQERRGGGGDPPKTGKDRSRCREKDQES